MFHLILHVWYKSGAPKRTYYYWDYVQLDAQVRKIQKSDRMERYEIEDRRRVRYGDHEKA